MTMIVKYSMMGRTDTAPFEEYFETAMRYMHSGPDGPDISSTVTTMCHTLGRILEALADKDVFTDEEIVDITNPYNCTPLVEEISYTKETK